MLGRAGSSAGGSADGVRQLLISAPPPGAAQATAWQRAAAAAGGEGAAGGDMRELVLHPGSALAQHEGPLSRSLTVARARTAAAAEAAQIVGRALDQVPEGDREGLGEGGGAFAAGMHGGAFAAVVLEVRWQPVRALHPSCQHGLTLSHILPTRSRPPTRRRVALSRALPAGGAAPAGGARRAAIVGAVQAAGAARGVCGQLFVWAAAGRSRRERWAGA